MESTIVGIRRVGMLLLLGCAVLMAQQALAAGKKAKPGDHIKECRNCPELVVLSPGTFMMGSPESEPERDPDEPQHRVTIAKPFAIATTTVTWNQWEACARDNWCEIDAIDVSLRTNPDGTRIAKYKDYGRGNRPAVGMSWYDAQRFVG
jgi:formylglycine-generating enzyme required for sulfatase activity